MPYGAAGKKDCKSRRRNDIIPSKFVSERGGSVENTGIRPEVIEEIRKLAEKYNISRVILFGSRARGDFKRASDIDLAVEGGDFARFALDVDEETSTLLKYDIVDMGRNIQEELRKAIETEGKVIYEKI